MRAIEYILMLSVLMLGMLLFWPILVDIAMEPLRALMDERIWEYLRLVLPFALSVITLALVMRKGAGMKMRELLREDGRKDGERKTAAAVFITLLTLFVLSSLFSPTLMRTGHSAKLTFISLLISLVFIPMQVFAEELLFRVIPGRMFFPEGFGRNRTADSMYVLFSGLFFAFLHGRNPEVIHSSEKWLMMANYFISGAALSLFAVLTDGFLTGIAFHSAVNLYVAVFANSVNGVIPSYSFFLEGTEHFELNGLISTAISVAVTLIIIKIMKKNGRKMKDHGKS